MKTNAESGQGQVSGSGAGDRPARILIVEDVKSAAEMLALFFEMDGMETQVAFDGVEAVIAAKEFRPDLICMDAVMPRMDGLEAARRIRETDREVVLVALCGLDGEDDRQRSLDAGFDAHLVKPVRPDELRELVNRLLAQ